MKNIKKYKMTLRSSLFLVLCTLLLTTTSCKKWNEYNFGDDYTNTGHKKIETNYAFVDADYEAFAAMLKSQATSLSGENAAILVRISDSIKIAHKITSIDVVRLYMPNYLKILNGKQGKLQFMLPTDEVLVDYTLFISPNDADIAYTLETADYDAMGTAYGKPGYYDNFDNTMPRYEYLEALLNQKYPLAVSENKVALSYKFFISSALGTSDVTDVFEKTTEGWKVVVIEDRYQMKSDYSFRYYNAQLLYETFLTGSLGKFQIYSLVGSKLWFSSSYGAQVSGFNNGAAQDEDDYLISPSLNFNDRQKVIMNLDWCCNFFSFGNSSFEILISTTYENGNPNPDDWTKLWEVAADHTSSWTFVNLELDLSEYIGNNNVHVAFRYYSNTTAAATAEVKNLLIHEPEEEI
jgi:hypothetical protein